MSISTGPRVVTAPENGFGGAEADIWYGDELDEECEELCW